MNKYDYSDISIGLTESFHFTVTSETMNRFLEISGDCNPLHCDSAFAEKHGFPGRVVYGMLISSFYSTLAGVYLPGERCLLQQIDIKFRKPVFIGDSLTVSGTVTEMSDAFRQITLKAEIRNQRGVKVNTAVIKAGVLR